MQKVVILGTGGTIAGTGSDPDRAWHYVAAQRSVAELVDAVPELASEAIEAKQVAQIDSKDMGWPVWQALGQAIQTELQRDDVAGVVITHGTDTLEETAWLLHALHDGRKPIVLTAAMRPATAPDADGPANLRDAVAVVRQGAQAGQGGVVVVMHGRVWPASAVRKAHTSVIDAFDGGDAPVLCELSPDGTMPASASMWPSCGARGWALLQAPRVPRVEVVTSHADADGWVVDALCAHAAQHGGLDGLIAAATGHGTLHAGLSAALERAEAAGVTVWRSSRVARGGVTPREGDHWLAAGSLTAAQARVALVLHLLERQRPAR
ncbi:asparaginase [Aquabacterium olei]|uniref:Asparaginase n=1 Tax=Aquabacterium olei TaxID=1296669 RepID=A0A2U8FSY4_9BURK|nr:asparaginase [Aquabacterium olei]AWI53997.1 asparaginase [Aquabacterium olei]